MRSYSPSVLTVLGVFFGACLTYNYYLFYFSAIIFSLVIIIKKLFKGREVDFLVKLFLISLLLRLLVVLLLRPFIFLYGNGLDVFGDGSGYFLNGVTIAETVKGNLADINSQIILNRRLLEFILPVRLTEWNYSWLLPDWAGSFPPVNQYQVGGFVYFLSALYYFFGVNPLHGIFVNCLLGAASGPFVYYIVKKISDNADVPKFTAIIASFFPSLFLWSITNQKDTFIIFLNLAIIVCLIKVLKERRYYFLFVIALLSFMAYFIRPKLMVLLFSWYAVILLFMLLSCVWRRKIILIWAVFSLTFVFLLPQSRMSAERLLARAADRARGTLVHFWLIHKGNVLEGGNYYKILEEKYYNNQEDIAFRNIPSGTVLKACFLALIHFILEPLPAGIHNLSTLIAYPQIIFVYFLLLFFIPGVIMVLKYYSRVFLVLFSCLIIFSFAVAFCEGNVGGLLRHRDIVTPVFIIFSSIGLLNVSRYRKYKAQNAETI